MLQLTGCEDGFLPFRRTGDLVENRIVSVLYEASTQ